MKTKTINDIEYIIYESGMVLNDAEKSYYFEDDLDYDGDIKCLHFYAVKDVIVRGNQYVGGNQYVRSIYLHLFAKWPFLLDRDSDTIKIGCESKTESEWVSFFANKEKINTDPSDRNYKKLESAFNVARQMKAHLVLMNDKPKAE